VEKTAAEKIRANLKQPQEHTKAILDLSKEFSGLLGFMKHVAELKEKLRVDRQQKTLQPTAAAALQ